MNLTIFIYFKITLITENFKVQASKKIKDKMTAMVDNIPSSIVKDC